jgi:hypothetical protein
MAKNDNQILLYEVDGEARVEVLYEGETVWLTQKQMSALFGSNQSSIARHIKNIYKSGELVKGSTMQKLHSAHATKPIQHYNLDMILSVGYRINSYRGTQFRIWATKQLREFVVKGFVMDDDRLKHGGSNYFDELTERVRHIRTSEVNFYKKVTAIFVTSIDYASSSEEAKTFYATVQNKFHYAIHGHTAAQLIVERVDSNKANLGLTTWTGKIVNKKNAVVAKNYLSDLELKRLELLVDQFLSFAELRSMEKLPMYMKDWVEKLDAFIRLNEKDVLTSAGKVSRKEMESKVRKELDSYRERVMAEKALEEDEFHRMLDDAMLNMLPPPADDIDDS